MGKCLVHLKECKAWCCKQLWILLPKEPTKDMKKYLRYHHIDVNRKALTIHVRCIYLTAENKCEIYNKAARPLFCKMWACKKPLDSSVI